MPHFSANVGGAERFAISVIRRLALRGHEVHVVAEDGTGTGGVKFHRARLTECADVVAGLAPDITVDWGLHVYADLHRLGGGTTGTGSPVSWSRVWPLGPCAAW